MHSYEQLTHRARHFAVAHIRFSDTFMDYAITVSNARRMHRENEVNIGEVANVIMGVSMATSRVAKDGLRHVIERRRFRHVHNDHFPTVELEDDAELYRVAVAIGSDTPYPSFEAVD